MSECTHGNCRCKDSRRRDGYRYRRYVCLDCGYSYKTAEILVDDEITASGRGALDRMMMEMYGIPKKQRDAIQALIDSFAGDK